MADEIEVVSLGFYQTGRNFQSDSAPIDIGKTARYRMDLKRVAGGSARVYPVMQVFNSDDKDMDIAEWDATNYLDAFEIDSESGSFSTRDLPPGKYTAMLTIWEKSRDTSSRMLGKKVVRGAWILSNPSAAAQTGKHNCVAKKVDVSHTPVSAGTPVTITGQVCSVTNWNTVAKISIGMRLPSNQDKWFGVYSEEHIGAKACREVSAVVQTGGLPVGEYDLLLKCENPPNLSYIDSFSDLLVERGYFSIKPDVVLNWFDTLKQWVATGLNRFQDMTLDRINAVRSAIGNAPLTSNDFKTQASWVAYVPFANFVHKMLFGKDLDGKYTTNLDSDDAVDFALIGFGMPVSVLEGLVAKAYVKGGATITQGAIKAIAKREAKLVASGMARNKIASALERMMIKNIALDIASRPSWWGKLLNAGAGIKSLLMWCMTIFGADTLANWAATDDVSKSAAFGVTNTRTLWRNKSITSDQALDSLKKYEDWINFALDKVKTSEYWNPFQMLFGDVFIKSIEIDLDNIRILRDEIAAAENQPDPQPTERKWKVSVSSSPAGANIMLNGVEHRVYGVPTLTPGSMILTEGFYRITVKLAGYQVPAEKTLRLP